MKYHVNRRFPPCTTCIGRHDTEKFRSGFSFFQQNRDLLFSEDRRPQAPRHRLKPLACPPHKQHETERSERKASRHLRPENSKESNSAIISIFRFCDTNKCAGSGSPIKSVSSIHTHTHTHTHTYTHTHTHTHTPAPTHPHCQRSHNRSGRFIFPCLLCFPLRQYGVTVARNQYSKINGFGRPVGNIRRIEQRRSIYTLSNM